MNKVVVFFLIAAAVILCAAPSTAVDVDQADIVAPLASDLSLVPSIEEARSLLDADDDLESHDFMYGGDAEDIGDFEDLESVNFDQQPRDSEHGYVYNEDELEDDTSSEESEDVGLSAGPKMTVILQHSSLNSGTNPYRRCTRSEENSLEGPRPRKCVVFYDLKAFETDMQTKNKNIFRKIRNAFRKVGRGIKKGFQKMGRGIKKGFQKMGRGIKKGFQKMGRGLKIGFKRFGAWMKKHGHHFAWIGAAIPGAGKAIAAKLVAVKVAAKVAAKQAVKRLAKFGAKKVAKKVAKKGTKKVAKRVAKKSTKRVAKRVAKKVAKKGAKKVAKKGTKKVAKRVAKKVAKKVAKEELKRRFDSDQDSADENQGQDSDSRFAAAASAEFLKDEREDEARDYKVLKHDFERLQRTAAPGQVPKRFRQVFKALDHVGLPDFSAGNNDDRSNGKRTSERKDSKKHGMTLRNHGHGGHTVVINVWDEDREHDDEADLEDDIRYLERDYSNINVLEEDLEHDDEAELDDAIQNLERDDSISQP